jgi:hypothetical protein
MSSNGEAALDDRLRADLYELVAVDVVSLPDATLRSELLAAANQLNAAIAARVASFDLRGLADADACRTTAVWLRSYGRYTDSAASRLVKQARVLRELPAVAEAAGRGEVTAEHVDRARALRAQQLMTTKHNHDRRPGLLAPGVVQHPDPARASGPWTRIPPTTARSSPDQRGQVTRTRRTRTRTRINTTGPPAAGRDDARPHPGGRGRTFGPSLRAHP